MKHTGELKGEKDKNESYLKLMSPKVGYFCSVAVV